MRNPGKSQVSSQRAAVESYLPPLLLVLVPVVFNAVMLWPELTTGAPTKNDSAFHWLMITSASQALSAGRNPFDFWIPELDLGYPQFLYYQNLPHLVVVGLHRLFLGTIGLETIFNATRYLLLVAFPFTVYWSMRRMEFSARASAVGALVCSLLSSDARYGFEYNSYVWRGLGVYTQLWGMHLFVVALACLHYALRVGRGNRAAIVSLALLALSHLLFAYIMGLASLAVLVAVSRRNSLVANGTRLAVIGVLSIAVASYMLVPFALSSLTYMSTLPGLNWGAHRPTMAIAWLIFGAVLDDRRLPVLTLLTALGIVVAIVRYRRDASSANRFALGGLLMWLVLYVAHPTVGPLSKLFPAHDGFVTARFVGVVEVFAILTIGVAGEWWWERARGLASRLSGATTRAPLAGDMLAAVTLLALLAPAFVERFHYYAQNGAWIAETRRALDADAELRSVLQRVKQQPGGRLYAGQRNNWGAQLTVGPSIKVADVVKFDAIPSVGPPYQALSLNGNFLWNFREGDAAIFDLMDVRWVLTPARATVPAFYEPVLRTSRYALYRTPTSGMAEYIGVLARRAVSTQKELQSLNTAWYLSSAPAARQYLRWDFQTAGGAFTPVARCPGGGRIVSETVEAQRMRLEVECAAPSSMVLKMTYHPNWKVTVDGSAVSTYMVTPSFLGFEVAPGRHVVEAEYRATPGKMWLLALGLVVLVGTLVLGRRYDH